MGAGQVAQQPGFHRVDGMPRRHCDKMSVAPCTRCGRLTESCSKDLSF
jgi:hypothetical protein